MPDKGGSKEKHHDGEEVKTTDAGEASSNTEDNSKILHGVGAELELFF